MSIINDALKKVQQGLNPKTSDAEATPPATDQNSSAYLYENPPAAETLPQARQEAVDQKPPVENKIKSIFALICAAAIIAVSGWYIYQQFQINIPEAQRLVKKSFFKLIHKTEIPAFKTKASGDLVPLAKLTINPTQAAPVTFNIHGIMSNSTGTGNLVLINDQVYQEGDEVDGAKIVKINLDSITILNNGAEQTIFVKN